MSRDEQRGYSRGYAAGRRRLERETRGEADRTTAAMKLFEVLVDGLILRGMTADEILDAQLDGMKVQPE